MKKIILTLPVKNESDIIESYCRYNLTYSDGLVIYERGSIDNTKEIIKKLIAEGLPIYLYDDPDIVFSDVNIANEMAKRAVDKYNADLVIYLEADEFICHIDGINPRETLECMCENVEYITPWRTYVYGQEPDITRGFMPNNFKCYRNPVLEYHKHKKAMISRFLLKTKQAEFTVGAHKLVFPPKHEGSVRVEIPSKLVYAHFPLRSKAQFMAKSITKRIYHNFILMSSGKGWGSQYRLVWDDLKEKGDASPDLIAEHAIKYGLPDWFWERKILEIGENRTVEGTLDSSFCADKLELRYTYYEEANRTFLRTILAEMDNAAASLAKNGMSSELREQNESLTQQITDIYNSNTWKTGKKIQKVFRMFFPNRKKNNHI